MKKAIRVLYATSEAHPLIKTGGLADVSGALPEALCERGADARLLLPGYPPALDAPGLRCVRKDIALLPGVEPGRLLQGRMPGTETVLYVLDCPSLFDRAGGPYQDPDGRDWSDNHLRFGAFSRIAALLGTRASPIRWRPDIIHCNDWQTGLAPAYLHFDDRAVARSVMSVHNIAFTGRFPSAVVPALLLPWSGFAMHGFEFYGHLSFLKAGLYYADRLTTVSESYAHEIQSEEFGGGLQGLLRARRHQLTGIMNGIDLKSWSPETDRHLSQPYGDNSLHLKAANKQALQERCALALAPKTPLLGMVSRLTFQKGIDLVVGVAQRLRGEPVQVAILGGGDARLEAELARLASDPGLDFALKRGYDETLAHQIEAGADMFLMPSRYEPCGLNQMYSMRYGTPPVVRRTGGLADSVIDTTPESLALDTATGFVFEEPSIDELEACLRRALTTFAEEGKWRRVQRNGMRKDFSWSASADRYLDVYRAVWGDLD